MMLSYTCRLTKMRLNNSLDHVTLSSQIGSHADRPMCVNRPTSSAFTSQSLTQRPPNVKPFFHPVPTCRRRGTSGDFLAYTWRAREDYSGAGLVHARKE